MISFRGQTGIEMVVWRLLRTPRPRLRIAAVAFSSVTTTVLAGSSEFALAQVSGGKVIAHSASVVVTQQELDNELRLAKVQASQRTDQTIKSALTQIIARKYMARQAFAAKLESEPIVDLDLLRSREKVLAGAYVQRELSAKSSTISMAEVGQYIEAHPDPRRRRISNRSIRSRRSSVNWASDLAVAAELSMARPCRRNFFQGR